MNDFPEKGLTFKEEAALARDGSADALQKLVMHNMRKAIAYARRICGDSLSEGILISLCYSSLTRSAAQFNPKFGHKLLHYAHKSIYGDLSRYHTGNEVVRHGETISVEACQHSRGKHGAIDSKVDMWDRENKIAPEHEIIEPDFARIFMRERMELVREIMGKILRPRERAIIDLYYISGETFKSIGERLGITRSAVEIVHSNALKKIRNVLLSRKMLFTP